MSINLSTRYRDGYRVANFLIGFGNVIKAVGAILGFFIGITIVFIPSYIEGALSGGNMYGNRYGQISPTGTDFLIGFFIGASIFFFFFITGIITSAYGQMLQATLDSAVHSSPFMDNDQKAAALGFASMVFSGSNTTTNDDPKDESTFDGPTISCPYCQTKMKAGTRFCTGCGERMP
jgi:hypothetical protein